VNEGEGTYVVALLDDHEVEHGQVGTDDGTADGLALALTLHSTDHPRRIGELAVHNGWMLRHMRSSLPQLRHS
jgi:hypothetical protein